MSLVTFSIAYMQPWRASLWPSRGPYTAPTQAALSGLFEIRKEYVKLGGGRKPKENLITDKHLNMNYDFFLNI